MQGRTKHKVSQRSSGCPISSSQALFCSLRGTVVPLMRKKDFFLDLEQPDGRLLLLFSRGWVRSRKAFVLGLRRITIRRKEKNQTFDEEISQPGERGPFLPTHPTAHATAHPNNSRIQQRWLQLLAFRCTGN